MQTVEQGPCITEPACRGTSIALHQATLLLQNLLQMQLLVLLPQHTIPGVYISCICIHIMPASSAAGAHAHDLNRIMSD